MANARELHGQLFDAYPEVDVKKVSRLEREAKELPNRSLVYGEIPFATVDEIFQLVMWDSSTCACVRFGSV